MTGTDPLLETDGEVRMQIRDSDFFSQLVCWAGPRSATPTLEELGDLFADPDFDEQRDVMNPSATSGSTCRRCRPSSCRIRSVGDADGKDSRQNKFWTKPPRR